MNKYNELAKQVTFRAVAAGYLLLYGINPPLATTLPSTTIPGKRKPKRKSRGKSLNQGTSQKNIDPKLIERRIRVTLSKLLQSYVNGTISDSTFLLLPNLKKLLMDPTHLVKLEKPFVKMDNQDSVLELCKIQKTLKDERTKKLSWKIKRKGKSNQAERKPTPFPSKENNGPTNISALLNKIKLHKFKISFKRRSYKNPDTQNTPLTIKRKTNSQDSETSKDNKLSTSKEKKAAVLSKIKPHKTKKVLKRASERTANDKSPWNRKLKTNSDDFKNSISQDYSQETSEEKMTAPTMERKKTAFLGTQLAPIFEDQQSSTETNEPKRTFVTKSQDIPQAKKLSKKDATPERERRINRFSFHPSTTSSADGDTSSQQDYN